MIQPDSFEDGFFQVYESFEQVPSRNYNNTKLSTQYQSMQCFICNKEFTFFHGAKTCNNCKFQCCSDCIHKSGDICLCCYAIENNPQNYDNLNPLFEYFNKFIRANNHNLNPQQTSIILLLNLLKRDEKSLHERVILFLYKMRKFYISDDTFTPFIQENLFRFMETSHDAQLLPIIINLMCDISIYNKNCIRMLRPDFEFYRTFLNPKNPNLSAATSRLILILSINHVLNPDQDASMKLILDGCKESVAYITASLTTLFPEPFLYENSIFPSSAECIFLKENLHDLVKNTLKLFEKKSRNTSIASQYFASIILLKVSESDIGLNELTKYIPMKPVIDTAIRLCPRTLGLKKQEGRIAIYLSRMIKNVWISCEKSSNRDDLLQRFFAEISNFIFDILDKKTDFDRYSYQCVMQSIAIELADDVMKKEKYRSLLMSPQFQEKLKQMKEDRRTTIEVKQDKTIDFLNAKNQNKDQLTQDQILLNLEREKENKIISDQLQEALKKFSESETKNYQLKAQIEKIKKIANNRFTDDGNKIKQCELTINNLRTEIESKSKEISDLTEIIKSKDDQISKINKQKTDIEGKLAILSSQLLTKEAEIAKNREILEQKTNSIKEKDKHIEELNINIKKLKKMNNGIQKKVKEEKQQDIQMQILNSNTINDLEIKEQISSNKYCSVFKVIKREEYAMKRMQKENSEMEEFKHFLNGYELIRLLNHPNIIKTFGIFLSDHTKTPPSILLEYCPNNMSQMIKNKTLSRVDIVYSLYQIAEGMKYLHSQKIIHRNLKPTNILITTDGIIKISDFSLSKMISEDELSMTLNIGKQQYTAPEMMKDENYDNKVDVYSYGVLIYFLLNEGNLPKLSYTEFVSGKKAEIPSEFTEFAQNLISDCWNFEPKDRPSFKTIINQLKENEYKLLPLTEFEKEEVAYKIEKLSKQIPHYSDLP